MPSLAQLQAEPWWNREIVTDELDWLGDELCRRTGRPRDAFGSKGNTAHLSGGHRSQEWLKNSDYCENRSYTTQSGLTADQLRHIGACDFTPGVWGTAANRALMVAQTRALWDAARAGKLTGLRQIFGTLNGQTAIGLNVLSDSTTIPDSSHLDHWHLTFDRRSMRDSALMARILETVLGDEMEQTDLLVKPTGAARTVGDMYADVQNLRNAFIGDGAVALAPDGTPFAGYPKPGSPLDNMARMPQLLAEHAAAPIDPAALKAVLLDPEVLTAIAKAVVDEDHRRSAA